jgi:hypothetical protein
MTELEPALIERALGLPLAHLICTPQTPSSCTGDKTVRPFPMMPFWRRKPLRMFLPEGVLLFEVLAR